MFGHDAVQFFSILALSNTVGYQQAMQNIQLVASGKVLKSLTETDAEEAMSIAKILSGKEAAAQIPSLITAIEGAQEIAET